MVVHNDYAWYVLHLKAITVLAIVVRCLKWHIYLLL